MHSNGSLQRSDNYSITYISNVKDILFAPLNISAFQKYHFESLLDQQSNARLLYVA